MRLDVGVAGFASVLLLPWVVQMPIELETDDLAVCSML